MRRTVASALLALVLAAAGCGDDGADNGGGDADAPDGGPGPRRAAVALQLMFDDGDGDRSTATLRCAPGGIEATAWLASRDEERLCREARRLAPFLAAAPDHSEACTQIYGGPQRARIRGRVGERSVERTFSRENGCRIADWERAQPLLPRPSR